MDLFTTRKLDWAVHSSRSCSNNESDDVSLIGRHLTFSLQVQEPEWRFNQTSTIDWSYLGPSITGVEVFYFSPST